MPIKIYIDQGHNPQNPNAGAEGQGLREQDITYDIGTRLAALLAANPNFTVRVSRKTPTMVVGTSNQSSLEARVNEANTWGADYFLSLHTNASDITSASGSEGLVYSRRSESYPLATQILAALHNSTGLANRGIQARPGLYVLRKTKMPAVLVEMGFITNPGDAALMSGSPELFARGIYNGLLKYFGL